MRLSAKESAAEYERGLQQRLNAKADRYALTLRMSKNHFEQGWLYVSPRPAGRVVAAETGRSEAKR